MKSGKGPCNACLACKPAILILMMSLLVGWQLRTTILKDMLHVFPISSAVTLESLLPCSSLDLLTNQTGKTKDMIIFIWGQYHWGSNIPSDMIVRLQIMSRSDYKNRACWPHTCLDTAQLSATDTLPMFAAKTMAQIENPKNFHSWERTPLNKSFSSKQAHRRVQSGGISHPTERLRYHGGKQNKQVELYTGFMHMFLSISNGVKVLSKKENTTQWM